MVDRPPSAMPSNERYACTACRANVHLLPWILVAPDDDTRVIAIEQK